MKSAKAEDERRTVIIMQHHYLAQDIQNDIARHGLINLAVICNVSQTAGLLTRSTPY